MARKKKEEIDSVDKLFIELESLDWRKAPYRGLIAEVGVEQGFPDKYARIYAHRNIFDFKNVRLACILKEKVNTLNNMAAAACA